MSVGEIFGKNNIIILKPFGPALAKIEMSAELIKVLNKYTDERIKKSKDAKEFILDDETVRKFNWVEFVGTVANSLLKSEHKEPVNELNIVRTWIGRQFQNEFKPIHYYNAGQISGIGYLKVPKKIESKKEEDVGDNGNLTLIHGSMNTLCNSTFRIIPKVGDFYFFPSYLMNLSYPFKNSDEEIRTIQFSSRINSKNIKGI